MTGSKRAGRVGRLKEAHEIGNHAGTTGAEKDQRRFRRSGSGCAVDEATGSSHAVSHDGFGDCKSKTVSVLRSGRTDIPTRVSHL